ncbi:MAG TPA: amidase [Acetobacteraceae bacterium]|nr:amidase [Acetobacteraceae bacterium]
MHTLEAAADALASGATTTRALVEDCLGRIADPAGEGGRAFIRVNAEAARAQADAIDALRRAGRAPSRYAGIPVSLKDLLDVAGEVSAAGSRALADASPAAANAPVVARLLAAGFVPVGRTNMTEFAYSGLGLNPHHGTPRAPWDRQGAGRIPGGSSSGAAVSVADGMAWAAIGTDTGGSCRIPAACCGVVGYKPTARRVPTKGAVPLSTTLDSIGPLARSVACCAIVDAVIAGDAAVPPPAVPVAGLRLLVAENFFLEGAEPAVAAAFERALSALAAAGARVERRRLPVLEAARQANRGGGFSPPEAYAWHRELLARRGAEYDPRVRARIERGAAMAAHEYVTLCADRVRLRAEADAATAGFDALLAPTMPIIPPRIDALESDEDYTRANLLTLRNTAVANFLDRCAISMPMHRAGEAPAGLMLIGETMGDARLFAVAAAVERALCNT